MTSPQQQADILLKIWQDHRALPPDERLEKLMTNFFSPLLPCEAAYEATIRDAAECIA